MKYQTPLKRVKGKTDVYELPDDYIDVLEVQVNGDRVQIVPVNEHSILQFDMNLVRHRMYCYISKEHVNIRYIDGNRIYKRWLRSFFIPDICTMSYVNKDAGYHLKKKNYIAGYDPFEK